MLCGSISLTLQNKHSATIGMLDVVENNLLLPEGIFGFDIVHIDDAKCAAILLLFSRGPSSIRYAVLNFRSHDIFIFDKAVVGGRNKVHTYTGRWCCLCTPVLSLGDNIEADKAFIDRQPLATYSF